MLRSMRILLAAAVLAVTPLAVAQAAPCKRSDYDRAINDSGKALRQINSAGMPEIDAKLQALKQKKHWSDEELQAKSQGLLQDARVEELDRQAYELYAKIDALSSNDPGPAPDCEILAELKAYVLELSATMKAKATYMGKKLDAALIEQAAGTGSVPPAAGREQTVVAVLPKPAKETAKPGTNWTTSTQANPGYVASPPATVTNLPPVITTQAPEQTYSPEEIQSTSRGFFGSISSGLAAMTAFTFEQLGRPVGYVLGNEGGGAFLAGLRYGKGTLYLKDGRRLAVFWHGPSVGYDVGANGARVLFLVYNMTDPQQLFDAFTGVDGSAYLVGGAGITFLTDGKLVLAPIRSGLGLRLGASAGYLRFTQQETWNPF